LITHKLLCLISTISARNFFAVKNIKHRVWPDFLVSDFKFILAFEEIGFDWFFFGEVKLRYIILEHREHLIGNRNSRP